jgi:hypothetical protein
VSLGPMGLIGGAGNRAPAGSTAAAAGQGRRPSSANGSSVGAEQQGLEGQGSSAAGVGSSLWQQGPLRSVSGGVTGSSNNRPWSPGPTSPSPRISIDGTIDSITSAGTFVTAAPGSYISNAAAGVSGSGDGSGAPAGAGAPEAVSAVSLLLPGLRVRMGVASGWLADREDCLNCKVLEVARGDLNCPTELQN